ncbi:MFS transporter [Bifidobacterium scardovii]|mgnify:CR=1 FL=1|uniref:Melibiose carrier protein n=1 Tax=Bifidobacterium scardovii TaxID=158787 RepID=A0A087D3E1_9BIFI|nr:MFS transporter [Bifidobacterium scardovii]KFI90041.1 melibiose carrier protein [Bifidobacterium scardovii]MDK6349153.1 MFS transporter [Bifidobacterium scardovii]
MSAGDSSSGKGAATNDDVNNHGGASMLNGGAPAKDATADHGGAPAGADAGVASRALRNALNGKQPRKITMKQAVGFGIGDFYGGGQLTIIATYLSLFWTRFCGMDIGTSQSVIGLSALISAVAALGFGVLDDNLYRYDIGRRFGRRRLLLLVISPLLLTGIFLWIPGQPLAVYAGTYVLWVVLAQAFQTAYNPLPGEMTADFNSRTKLSTVRLFISTGAATVIPLAGGAAISVFGESTPTGYMVFTIGTTVLFALAIFVCWRRTWEMTPDQAGFGAYERGEVHDGHIGAAGWLRRAVKVMREYASTLRIAEFRKHLSIYLLVQVSMDVFGQTFVFFVVYNWNRSAAFASLLLGCAVVSLPLMPLFGFLMTKIGPKRLYAINFAGCLTGAAWMFAAWMLAGVMPDAWWTVFAVAGALWFFAFKSLCGYLPWAVFPYIADVDQVVTRRYRSATFSGIQASFRQLGSGIATIAVGVILEAVGFDSTKPAQSLGAQIGLSAVLLGWFAFAMVVCWVISSRLTIDKHTDDTVLREVDRLRAGGSKRDAAKETRRIIEDLTGLPYDQCWLNGGR